MDLLGDQVDRLFGLLERIYVKLNKHKDEDAEVKLTKLRPPSLDYFSYFEITKTNSVACSRCHKFWSASTKNWVLSHKIKRHTVQLQKNIMYLKGGMVRTQLFILILVDTLCLNLKGR